MSMLDILYEAVDQVNGVKLAGVVGVDGLGVEMILDEESLPHDYETAEMELSWLAAAASTTSQRLGVGQVYDITVETDHLTYLVSLIVPGYYAVLGVTPDNKLGRARFAVQQMAYRLQKEL